jgi:hypothetical protein
MNLQLFRHGIGRSTLGRLAGLLFVFSALGFAQAQVATHTQLTASSGDHGVTYTATVSDVAGNPAGDGIVTLVNAEGRSFGSAFVKDGTASITVDQPLSGRIYADYSGSEGFRASNTQAQAVSDATSTLPDFTITANPTSLSLNPGEYGTIVLTITPINGFNDMVTLSCSSNPPASACTFSPITLTPLNGKALTSSLQITTQAGSGASLASPFKGMNKGSHVAFAIVLPGLLALAGLGTLRKRSGLNALRVFGIVALLAAGSLGLSSCSQRYGYLNHPPEPNNGIAAGSYNVTIAAYSNNGASVTSHTLSVALKVK